jgi:CO/xanthine dehydrogenase FAD-binding subunit
MTINAHPELPEFEYIQPTTLLEASQFLAQHPGVARPLLGGTDIFVRMRDGFWRDKYLVDVKNLDGTAELRFDPQLGLTIGAAVNMNRVLASPDVQRHYMVLAEACRSVASYQLRTRATVVGNICNASPAGDTIGACLVYGGIVKIHGVDGFRTAHLSDFFLGPGKTILRSGDIVTSLQLPLPPSGSAGTYIKLGRNTWSDLSIVGVTALGYPDAAAKSGYRFSLALASVAPVPLLVHTAQAYLANNPIEPEAFKEAARLAEEACTPIDDVRGSARYRKAMVRRLSEIALVKTWQKMR